MITIYTQFQVLERRIEPENKEDKYAVAVIDNQCRFIGHLPKGRYEKYAKTF